MSFNNNNRDRPRHAACSESQRHPRQNNKKQRQMTEFTVRDNTQRHNNGTGPQKRNTSLYDRDRSAERGRPDN